MKATQILFRWLPTFLSFPLGGLLVVFLIGPVQDWLVAAVSGAIVGLTVGFAQWWALRPLEVSPSWVWGTGASLMIASPLAWEIIDYSTSRASLAFWGAITGGAVGLTQAMAQRVASIKIVSWSLLVASSWCLAWFISASVIVDAEANYAVFGSTGAIAAVSIQGLLLNRIFGKDK